MRTKWIVVAGVTAGVLVSGTAVAAATDRVVPTVASSPSASPAGISRAEAERIALAKVPGARVVETERDVEGGRAVWNVHLITAKGAKVEVKVDLSTGAARIDDRRETEPGDDRGRDDSGTDDHGGRDDSGTDDHGGRDDSGTDDHGGHGNDDSGSDDHGGRGRH
ncbi:PepSY domain-containing protein [Hamadaea sp. NPDC051192]|uniref:PepSY domain-containing protein n=1 Tax=Hamadaea sp. NPDC051192 TaxID=3154940 RepID=UPI00344A33A0